MGNHHTNIFWSTTHPNPNCTLCPSSDRDTWPHLYSTNINQHIKKLQIARHNKALYTSYYKKHMPTKLRDSLH